MQRDVRVLLWDVKNAAEQVSAFVDGRAEQDYDANPMLRSAVERQLITIGEALNQLSRQFPALAERVPSLGDIVGFRNVLVRGYAIIDDARVWQIATERVPQLIDVVTGMLREVTE